MRAKLLLSITVLLALEVMWLFASSILLPPSTTEVKAQGVNSLCAPPIIYLPFAAYTLIQTWESEPNSPYWEANGPMQPGQTYRGYPNDQYDYWSIYLSSPGSISVDLSDLSAPGQLQLFYQVATEASRVAIDSQPPFHIDYIGPSGLYYVLVGVSSGFNSVYPYSLRIATSGSGVQQIPPNHKANALKYLNQWVGYTFEEDTENWGTSEGAYKLATLEVSQEEVCKGRQSLKLTTELRSDEGEVYRETEAVGYFDNAVPQGMDHPGPYDLTGNRVSCYVYVPEDLAMEPPQAFYNLFIKDTAFGNQYNARLYMTEDTADTWQQMELIVGERNDGYIDDGFDTTNVRALGIVIGIVEGSPIRFTGPVYIDHCEIEYP